MLNTFFNNFELLADVPNGMQKLRELILQLAIQGKLGTQNPKDESAAVLLEKIRAQTDKLIKEKKIKKIKSLPPIEANEIPYEKPDHWAWCRLSEIIQISSGNFLPSHKMAENGHIPVFGGNGITGYHDQYNVTKPTLVIGRVGFYCGSVHITPELAWITDNAFSTYFLESHIDLKFLYWLLKGTDLSIRDNSTAQPVISGRKVYPIIVGLPPYEEQKRIVTKVDQLMALCDELEARQEKKHEQRILLNNAALDKLLTAPTPEEFAQHWQRICDNFVLLYDAPETVGQLRQAILQLAVQGKLVPQYPGDEPAAVLLEKIRVERERLSKEKKIKKSKPLTPIELEEVSTKLLKGWKWVKLGELIESMTNGIYKPAKYYDDNGIGCLRMYNILDGKINLLNLKRMILDEREIELYELKPGDLLVNRVNSRELVGKAGVIGTYNELLIFESKNIRVRFILSEILPNYINILFQTVEVRKVFEGDAKQTCGQASISQPQIANILTPLPPFEEQRRIVARVDQLMALCDELEAGLVQAQTEGGKLMEAVVHHVLAA
ncbi:MAG: type I restriction enzyme, S subunit [Candidatus Methanocomedens sp.]|nr:MAG: type I restriction enzyme, S subunit [ANME-2 cluster archaeon]